MNLTCAFSGTSLKYKNFPSCLKGYCVRLNTLQFFNDSFVDIQLIGISSDCKKHLLPVEAFVEN